MNPAAENSPPTLNLIGCGRLGKTLGHLFQQQQVFRIQDVLTQSLASANVAVAFIGAGKAATGFDALRPTDAFLLAVPDEQIVATAARLAGAGLLRENDLVFHCSGALSSALLAPCTAQGARTASAHPLLSFAEPAALLAYFAAANCHCAIEGETSAVAELSAAFTRIGAHPFRLASEAKLNYHAAAVIASNYLVTLMEQALQASASAQIPREVATQFLLPLMQQTLNNLSGLTPAAALTGPIARGEFALVRQQQAALASVNPALGDFYATLANATATLAGRPVVFAQHK